jgi:hypothetical protein
MLCPSFRGCVETPFVSAADRSRSLILLRLAPFDSAQGAAIFFFSDSLGAGERGSSAVGAEYFQSRDPAVPPEHNLNFAWSFLCE